MALSDSHSVRSDGSPLGRAYVPTVAMNDECALKKRISQRVCI